MYLVSYPCHLPYMMHVLHTCSCTLCHTRVIYRRLCGVVILCRHVKSCYVMLSHVMSCLLKGQAQKTDARW